MTTRTTVAELESLVGHINMTHGFDRGARVWQRIDGHNVSAVGMFYLDGAYGGYALYQIVSDGGGVINVLGGGHQSKRELADRLRAFIAGGAGYPSMAERARELSGQIDARRNA